MILVCFNKKREKLTKNLYTEFISILGMNFVSFTSKFSTNSHNKPKELYKHLIRQCRKLPVGPREYYKFMIRQSYKQHVHEHDKERINQIINRAYEDAEWVLKKYLGNKNK